MTVIFVVQFCVENVLYGHARSLAAALYIASFIEWVNIATNIRFFNDW